MTAKHFACWKCGEKLPSHCLPIGHYDLCPHCREDLHTCRMCRAYDPKISGKCRKDEADFVSNKERANYCHYFSARTNAHKAHEQKSKQTFDELASLFGDNEQSLDHLKKDYKDHAQEAKQDLNSLFGEASADNTEPLTAEEKAKRELDKLFGK